jgi:bifunctional isochorismate lyase/aryl carrier protein
VPGLPTIEAYALPDAASIPASRVPWRIEARRAALLIHDMQNYFVRAFPVDGSPIRDVIAHIDGIRRACRAQGVPVYYSAQPGHQDPKERGLQSDFWGPGMTSSPEHRGIVTALAPEPGDTVLTKWRYSAFQRAPFEESLRALGRDQLIITGIYASIGCTLTAADAFMRDVQPFFVADAVADFTRARHDAAVAFVADRCAAPTTTVQVLAALADRMESSGS